MNEKKVLEINNYVDLYNLTYKKIDCELESLMIEKDLPVALIKDLITTDEIKSVIKTNTSYSINRVKKRTNSFDEVNVNPYVTKFKNRLQIFVMEDQAQGKVLDKATIMSLEQDVENILKKQLVFNRYGLHNDKVISLWLVIFGKINSLFYSVYFVKLAVVGVILSAGMLIYTWRDRIIRSLFYLVTSVTSTGIIIWIIFLPLSKIWIFKNLSTVETARELSFDVSYNYFFKELYSIGSLVMMNGLILLIILILIEQLKSIYSSHDM
ncbi:MAG: hypothetical protein ACRCST_12000 [Turicibacter sp.]